jgi:hypothetical protein
VKGRIPAYNANGLRRREYSLEAIERLEASGKVIVERDEAGQPIAAQFRPRPEPRPRQTNTISTGTYYSYEELVVDAGHYVWTHKDLKRDAAKLVGAEVRDVNEFLRQIFFAVPSSCMAVPKSHAIASAISLGPKKQRASADERRAQRKAARKARRREKAKSKKALSQAV